MNHFIRKSQQQYLDIIIMKKRGLIIDQEEPILQSNHQSKVRDLYLKILDNALNLHPNMLEQRLSKKCKPKKSSAKAAQQEMYDNVSGTAATAHGAFQKESREFLQVFIGDKNCQQICQAIIDTEKKPSKDETPVHEELLYMILLKNQSESEYCFETTKYFSVEQIKP